VDNDKRADVIIFTQDLQGSVEVLNNTGEKLVRHSNRVTQFHPSSGNGQGYPFVADVNADGFADLIWVTNRLPADSPSSGASINAEYRGGYDVLVSYNIDGTFSTPIICSSIEFPLGRSTDSECLSLMISMETKRQIWQLLCARPLHLLG